MLKKSNIQNAILSVIAVGVISIVIQNQIIINQLSEQQNRKSHFSTKVNNVSPSQNFVSLPVNADGSINVNVTKTLDVNIEEVGGNRVFRKIPVEIK